jgi:pilus assembly protein CpaB
MNRSRLLMIGGLALAVGLLVSFSVYSRLRNFAGASAYAGGVPVVVAADDIPVGSRLDVRDVHVINLPQAAVPQGAFTGTSQILGRGAILPMSKGEFILNSKLAPLNAGAGLPSMIPQGMRAVSVRVNDVVSVAGFVQPGTHVDVLATGSEGSERQTTTVLENVLVLAVGKSLDRSATADAQTAPVITLAVSPDDAQKLALVSQEGRIQLSLRNPVDTKKGGIAATRASSVYPGATPVAATAVTKPKLHKVVTKAPAAPPAPYQVEMIRGNKKEENKFETPPPPQ